MDFIDIKSHPLLGRGKSCYSCTDAQHFKSPMPLLPAILRERFGENVGRHIIGIAVPNLAEAEFVGNIV